ncbi:hypothetical protein HNQ96_006191 [Aminobacter lissarensis]|uniref:Uncharacterized protein n=1 Tax=Aminobacter carboxidus TaxID=376165 RepID=A0A8E1WLM4_9HYPH|nr:hypothetical protein [Aminobacter lissarensis]
MNGYAKPVIHCKISRLIHHQFCARRHELRLQIAPQERERSVPASSYTGIMLKMSLFDIATVPLLTPPITEDLAVPISILRDRQASDQKVTEAITCKTALECVQNLGCRPDLGNV